MERKIAADTPVGKPHGFRLAEFFRIEAVVRQFAVPDMKRISFCLAQALRFGIAG
jgi:hypothetical protein